MGSPAAAALIAQIVFWALLLTGALSRARSAAEIGLFVGL
jgi:hypothetical protein